MQVGDIILEVRELITDVPQTMAAPILTSVTPVTVAGGLIVPGTYFIVLTQTNQWGETGPSTEVGPITVSLPNNAFQIAWSSASSGPFGTGVKVYAGFSSGQETQWGAVSPIPSTPFTLLALTNNGAPPIHSSAYNPDTDGGAFAASSLFRWLSQGLTECSRIAGGIMDYTGVSTVQGQPLYVMPGEWQSFSDVWYDGYPVSMIGRNTMFRKNTVQSSVLGAMTISVRDNRVIAEVWPQPARTAEITSTTAPFGLTDITINVADTSGFALPFGFAQLGPVAPSLTTEIVSYSALTGTTISGCVRGLSGGIAISSVSAGITVQEINLFMNGKRIFTTPYAAGSSQTVIPVPAGWDELLVNFMLSKAKQAEQDFQESARLRKVFDEQITGWARTNRQLAGPRQITLRDEEFSIANPHPFGGTVIP